MTTAKHACGTIPPRCLVPAGRREASGASPSRSDAGFTLVEMMIAMLITTIVMGGAVSIARSVQHTYQHELDDVSVEQEGRYTLDWIARVLSSAGSNPYGLSTTNCPAANTLVTPLRLDPNGNGLQDDVRVQADAGVPNGVILGSAPGACTEANEDVTIAIDGLAGQFDRRITRLDPAEGATAVPQSDSIFADLQFTYLTGARVVTTNANLVRFIRVRVRGRSRTRNPETGQQMTFDLQKEVRRRPL